MRSPLYQNFGRTTVSRSEKRYNSFDLGDRMLWCVSLESIHTIVLMLLSRRFLGEVEGPEIIGKIFEWELFGEVKNNNVVLT